MKKTMSTRLPDGSVWMNHKGKGWASLTIPGIYVTGEHLERLRERWENHVG